MATGNSVLVIPSFAVNAAHPVLKPFKERPFSSSYSCVSALITFAILTCSMFAGMAAGKLISRENATYIAMLFVIGAFLVLYKPLKTIFRLIEVRQEQSYCRQKKEPQRKPVESAVYVGLSYSRGLALLDSIDWAWDRGWLYAKDGFLVFEGVVSGFSLPSNTIDAIRPIVSDLREGRDELVLIEWTSPDGCRESVTLADRGGESAGLLRIQALVDSLESPGSGWDLIDGTTWPFRSSEGMQAFTIDERVAIGADRKGSTIFAVAVVVVWIGASFLLEKSISGIGEWLWPVLAIAFSLGSSFIRSSLIERAIRQRYLRAGLFTECIK